MRRSAWQLAVPAALLIVAAPFLLRHYVLESFKIPSGSMIPSILVGDHIFVSKSAYASAAPRRGQMIVFAYPEQPQQDFIKRIVAEPGDTLEMREGRPWINGWQVPSCALGEATFGSELESYKGDVVVEFLEAAAYLAFYTQGGGAGVNGPWKVKADEYFVLGDNRNNAHDSRMWFGGEGGGVPRGNIRGRGWFVWLGVSPNGPDWSRVGASLREPSLPPALKSLQSAFDRCMSTRPTVAAATPPPSAPSPPSPP
jgi:signal peptidase I